MLVVRVGACHLRPSEQEINAYDSIIVEFTQVHVHGSSDSFLACIRTYVYLPPCDSAESLMMVATRNQLFFQFGEYFSPSTPAVFHVSRKWIVLTKRIVAVHLLPHDDDLL